MDLMNIGTTKETTDVTLYNPVNSEILTNEDRSEMTIYSTWAILEEIQNYLSRPTEPPLDESATDWR